MLNVVEIAVRHSRKSVSLRRTCFANLLAIIFLASASAQQTSSSESEVRQLKALVQQLQLRVEQLEKRLDEKQRSDTPAKITVQQQDPPEPVQTVTLTKTDRSLLD